ncbi:SDR family oxidoreductase [Cohnella sp. GCM10012308]
MPSPYSVRLYSTLGGTSGYSFHYAQKAPLGRVGQNEEIAPAVAYLMTNTFTTGSAIYVDGGYTLL